MSKPDAQFVKRMDFVTGNGGAMIPDPDGDYIRHTDHQSLLAEAESQIVALQSRLDAVGRLADELETYVDDYSDDMSYGAFSRLSDLPEKLRSAALGGESRGDEEVGS